MHIINRLSLQRILCVEWIKLFFYTQEKSIIKNNIKNGWQGTDLLLFIPI